MCVQPLNCVEPGTHISVKSTSEIVHVTLAYAAATSCLTSIAEWRDLAAGGAAYRRQLAAADAAAVHTQVHNRLGVDAQVQLDFGDDMCAPAPSLMHQLCSILQMQGHDSLQP